LWDIEATYKGHAQGPQTQTLRLQRGDIRVRTRGDLTAVVWRDKRDVCLLTNIHDPSREGSYRNEHGNARKPTIVADYNRQIGHVDNADRMAKSHTVSRRILSGEKSVFPHVGPEHCQKLHPFIFMWWEENLTQRFSTHPYQRDTRMGRA